MRRTLFSSLGYLSPIKVNVGGVVAIPRRVCMSSSSSSSSPNPEPKPRVQHDDDEFQPLDIVRSKQTIRGGPRMGKRREKKEVPPPRYLKMPTDQDWGNVWPTARTFHPASVPLPLHQGYVPQHLAPPNKWGNLELMKIPNFLHLTPPVIKRQCEAIKKFCTPFPRELRDDAIIEEVLPIEVTTNDYCHSSPTIRDIRSRIVTLQIKLDSLGFDYHAKDKFLRLVGSRYNSSTDMLTLTIENCPLRKQNYDYAMYLLTALYHESLNKENWEDDKVLDDMEKYTWQGSPSESSLTKVLGLKEPPPPTAQGKVKVYVDAVTNLHNDGEDLTAIEEYGKSVRELLNLPSPQ